MKNIPYPLVGLIENRFARLCGDSSAATITGKLRAVINRGIPRYIAPFWIKSNYRAASEYQEAENKRKSHPEMKRAANDPVFRKTYLAKLNRELNRLINPKMRTITEIIAANDAGETRRNRIAEIYEEKEFILNRKFSMRLEAQNIAGILVEFTGLSDADWLRSKFGMSLNLRGYNAVLTATRRTSFGTHTPAKSWRNSRGRWKSERAAHHERVTSFGLISGARNEIFTYRIHNSTVTHTLPEGYEWREDDNGLCVVELSSGADYHPTAKQLALGNVAEFIGLLSANREARLLAKAKEVAEKAEMEGVYVCMADSLRSGNCLMGSQNFANRLQLNAHKHYGALEILEMAKRNHIGASDISRLRLAISAAVHRTRKENTQGFANLAEHCY